MPPEADAKLTPLSIPDPAEEIDAKVGGEGTSRNSPVGMKIMNLEKGKIHVACNPTYYIITTTQIKEKKRSPY